MTARATTIKATATKARRTSDAASIDKINAATANIKAPKTKASVPEEQHTPIEEQGHTESSYFDQFQNMFEQFKMPSGKRMLCSIVAQLFVLATGVYSGIQVGALLSVGAMVLTGSGFLAFLAMFLACGVALYGSLIAGARVARYIALGEIDQDFARVKGWFGSKFASVKQRFASDVEPDHA